VVTGGGRTAGDAVDGASGVRLFSVNQPASRDAETGASQIQREGSLGMTVAPWLLSAW
jgi:hypothetical protein